MILFWTLFFPLLHLSTILSVYLCSIMESLQFTQHFHQSQFHFMNKYSPKLKPKISFRTFWVSSSHSASSSTLTKTQNLTDSPTVVPEKKRRAKASNTQFKENWLASLSYPFPEKTHLLNCEHDPTQQNDGFKWVLGIDPDVSGAVALLKTNGSVSSAQVSCLFSSLLVKVLSFFVALIALLKILSCCHGSDFVAILHKPLYCGSNGSRGVFF